MNMYGYSFKTQESFYFLLSKDPIVGYITIEKLREEIRDQICSKYGVDTKIIYKYSLVDDKIPYPICDGVDLYIGEAISVEKGIDDRFFHINSNKTETTGNNTKSNYTLSCYYHQGKKMKLEIHILDSNIDRRDVEDTLTRLHLIKFGALPMATSAGGGKHTPSELQIIIDAIPPSE